MARKVTSKRVAKIASRILRSKGAGSGPKATAASALSQRERRKNRRK